MYRDWDDPASRQVPLGRIRDFVLGGRLALFFCLRSGFFGRGHTCAASGCRRWWACRPMRRDSFRLTLFACFAQRNYSACFKSSKRCLKTVEVHNNGLRVDQEYLKVKTWALVPLRKVRRQNIRLDNYNIHNLIIGCLNADRLSAHENMPTDELAALVLNQKAGRPGGPSNRRVQAPCWHTDGVAISAVYDHVDNHDGPRGKFHQCEATDGVTDPADAATVDGAGAGEAGADGTEAPAGSTESEQTEKKKTNKRETQKERRRRLLTNPFHLEGVGDRIIVAVDPGRVNIWYAYRPLDDQVFILTRKEYHHLAHVNSRKEKMRILGLHLQGNNLQLASNGSLKGVDVDALTQAVGLRTRFFHQTWETYFTNKKQANLSFDAHCMKTKVLQEFAGKFKEGLDPDQQKRIVVGYGNGTFPSHGPRGEIAVPTTKAFLTICHMYPTIDPNEWGTTVTCNDCHQRLLPVRTDLLYTDRNGSERYKVNRGLKRCQSDECKSGSPFKCRDLNGAKNIAEVTQAILDAVAERRAYRHPEHLTRRYHENLGA